MKKIFLSLMVIVLFLPSFSTSSFVPSVPSPNRIIEPRWVPQMSPLVQVSGEGQVASFPDVAFNSVMNEYLVVWRNFDKSISGRRISSRGEVISEVFEVASVTTYQGGPPRVAYDVTNNRYLVVWSHNTGGINYTMKGRFIPWDGPSNSYLDFVIDSTKLASGIIYAVAYAFTAGEFMVVWEHTPDSEILTKVVGRRVLADGSGFPAGTFVIAADSTYHRQNPDIAYNVARNEYLVTYDDFPKVNDNVWGTRLSFNGAVLGSGEFSIAGWPDEEAYPSVAACNTADQYLVTWHSIQSSGDGIFSRYVSGDGTPGTVNNLFSSSSWETFRQTDTACGVINHPTYDPRYLVTWEEDPGYYDQVNAREVLTNNLVSDPVEIRSSANWTSVAGGQINFLVAIEATQIYARIVGNTQPRAAFTTSPNSGTSSTNFYFDASISTDNTDDVSDLQVRWDWENDGIYDTSWSFNKLVQHQYVLQSWQGIVDFYPKLIVTDGHGVTDTTSTRVTVYNAPPEAGFFISPACGSPSTNFFFDASPSNDPEGGGVQARWDWQADGSYDTSWSVVLTGSHSFPSVGVYSVRLAVKDNWDQESILEKKVTVTQSGKCPFFLPLVFR